MLSLNGISKSFKGKLVVDNVNLHIDKNQIYGLVGSNGAGKTTIMKELLTKSPKNQNNVLK